MMSNYLMLAVLFLVGSIPLFATERQCPSPSSQRNLISVSLGSEDSVDELSSSRDGLPTNAVLRDSYNSAESPRGGGKGWVTSASERPLNRSCDDGENSSESGSDLVSTPTLPTPKLFCSNATVNKYKTHRKATWQETMVLIYEVMGEEIKPCEVALIVDNDGTLNTHPDPLEKYEHDLGEREKAKAHIMSAKKSGMHVFVSSAWSTTEVLGDQKGFKETLTRLEHIGCDSELLSIKGDWIEKPFMLQLCKVDTQGIATRSKLLSGFQCGHVVSCKDAFGYGFLRKKFFAPAVAAPDLCPLLKLVVLVDDSFNNIQEFRKDAEFNPYGKETVALLPILLRPYLGGLETSGNSEKIDL